MKMTPMILVLFAGGLTCSCTSQLTSPNSDDSINSAEIKEVTKISEPKLKSESSSAVMELPIERVFELQQTDSILLIDTRTPIFYKLGHIDGAYSLPLKSFEKSFDKSKVTLDAAEAEGKKIVIYCQSEKCSDSYIMARALSEAGYKVSIFKGGWELWKMSGL